MTTAYRCDRCGDFNEQDPAAKLSWDVDHHPNGWPMHMSVKGSQRSTDAEDYEAELCPECFEKIIDEFDWEMESS